MSSLHAYDQVSQRVKKIISYFHTIKIQKYVLACIIDFNNHFIKVMRTMLIF